MAAARTLRLRLLLVPRDETFSPGAISRPAPLPSVWGFFFARLAAPSPRRFPLRVLENGQTTLPRSVRSAYLRNDLSVPSLGFVRGGDGDRSNDRSPPSIKL
jgi:hypothetical protein